MRVAPLLAVVAAASLAGCSTAPLKPDPRDPFERMNRTTFAVNEGLDRAIARPIASTYRRYAPQFVQTGLANFFANLRYPIVMVNSALQGKIAQAGRDTGRFVINTTLGFAGFLDPASAAGLDANDEDFGQTLGVWGVGHGPYLVLPILGPSSVRDTTGLFVDRFADPVNYIEDDAWRWGVDLTRQLERRARLLPASDALARTYDRYAFLRSAFFTQREFQVRDGAVDEVPADEGFEDMEDDLEEPGNPEDVGESPVPAPAPGSDEPDELAP
jgi:phospholipid-binding lipoprotein MlaA